MATKKDIIFDQFQDGIAFSKYLEKGFDDLNNVDLLTQVGTAQCNFALKKESGSTITAGVIPCVTKMGNIYWFSVSDTNIWNRATDGTYSAISSNSNSGGHYDAIFYDNWVYYATNTEIGRMMYDGSNRSDSYKTFKHSGSPYHPMGSLNNILFIGDSQSLASINTSGTFSNEAICLQAHMDISCIRPYGYDIAIFTNVDQKFLNAGVFRYDTTSAAWSSEDYLDEQGINVAISSNTSDEIFVLAGSNGDIYYFDGVKFQWVNKLRGISTVNTHNRLACSIGKKSYFSPGNGVVYSLSHPLPGGQAVLNKEYVVSAGAGATIYSMCGYNGKLFVSWGLSGSYGIDTVDTNYVTATITTPIYIGRISTIEVGYEMLPTGTSIMIEVLKDDGNWITMGTRLDTIGRRVYTANDVGNFNFVQARITLTPNNSGTPATPVIQYIRFL